MKIRAQYTKNKEAKVGESCKCPSCNTQFIKTNYQQAFCKSKGGTICKDKYWNTVTPNKRNNTTRISPASARWMAQQSMQNETYGVNRRTFDPHDYEHPFSSEALGQWDD